MTSLKDSAKAFVPRTSKTVADLNVLTLDLPTEKRTGKDRESGEPYEYNVVVFMGEDYRLPDTVQKDIQTILTAKPELKTVKVVKKGQGLNTSYTVIPIE